MCLQILSQVHNSHLHKSKVLLRLSPHIPLPPYPLELFVLLLPPLICLDLDIGNLPSTVFLRDQRDNIGMQSPDNHAKSHTNTIIFISVLYREYTNLSSAHFHPFGASLVPHLSPS